MQFPALQQLTPSSVAIGSVAEPEGAATSTACAQLPAVSTAAIAWCFPELS